MIANNGHIKHKMEPIKQLGNLLQYLLRQLEYSLLD